MAHTDKTDPYWVQSQRDPNATIWHGWACENNTQRRRYDTGATVACDLPDPGTYRRRTNCRYWSYDTWRRLYSGSNAFDRHAYYYGPERARTRAALVNARRDYNAHGDTDVDVLTDQHRNAPWGGGWWD